MSSEQAFAQSLWKMSSAAMVTHGIALGSKLGLFDVIAELTKPETAQTIADKCGYKERCENPRKVSSPIEKTCYNICMFQVRARMAASHGEW